MKYLIIQFIKNEDGVTAIEYALIGVAMAVVVGTAVSSESGFAKKLQLAFARISQTIEGATDSI